MPIPLAVAGLIGAGVSAAGNTVSTILNNRAQRKLSMDMYNLQRKDALADWQRQVDYESPAAQMARYKAAGINPNMVYGNQANSPTVRSTPMDVPNLSPVPVPDMGGAIMQYQQIKQQQAQTDLTQQSLELARQREQLNSLEIVSRMIGNEQAGFTLEQKRRLADTVFDTSLANLESIKAGNALKDQTFRQNEVMNPLRIKQLAADIALKDAGTKRALQEVVVSKAMLPIRQKQALAAIDNLMESTEGKQLDNVFKRVTQGTRQTILEYQMEYLNAGKNTQEAKTAQEKLRNALLQNDVDMQGVNNILNSLGKIKNIISPFSKGEATTESTEHILDDQGTIRGTKVKTSTQKR